MPRGVILVDYTDQGRRNIKDSPDRAEASKIEAAKLGVQVKDLFYTPSGPHDVAIIIEAEGPEPINKFMSSVQSSGNVKMKFIDENRAFRLRKIGLHPPEVHLRNLLAAASVLAATFAGCAPQADTVARGSVSPGLSAAENSAAARPHFAHGGPDAGDYGASSGYPIGDRATCSRPAFLVGCHSHFDQVYEGRLVRRATTPSPLARAPSEPVVRYEYQGRTFNLDDYLARNPATGLLVVRDDTILIERYQYARHD